MLLHNFIFISALNILIKARSIAVLVKGFFHHNYKNYNQCMFWCINTSSMPYCSLSVPGSHDIWTSSCLKGLVYHCDHLFPMYLTHNHIFATEGISEKCHWWCVQGHFIIKSLRVTCRKIPYSITENGDNSHATLVFAVAQDGADWWISEISVAFGSFPFGGND